MRKDAHAGEIKVRLYFTPDLPVRTAKNAGSVLGSTRLDNVAKNAPLCASQSDVVLQERQHLAHELPESYQRREVWEWCSGYVYLLLYEFDRHCKLAAG